MRHIKLQHFIILVTIVFFSCNSNNTQEDKQEKIKTKKKITITDPNMTRFNITMNQALDLIERATTTGKGGEVFIPKLFSYRVGDLKDVLLDLFEGKNSTEIISVRPGEKLHESLLTIDELRDTYESKHDYILIEKNDFHTTPDHDYEKTSLNENYSSDKVKLLTKDELKDILLKEGIL